MANKSQSFWRIQSVMIINRYTDCWDDRCARPLHFYGPFNVVFIYKHCRVPCIFPSQPFTDQKRVRLSIGSGFGKNFSKMNTTGREIFGRKTRNRSWMSVRWWGVALASQTVKSLVFWLFHSKKNMIRTVVVPSTELIVWLLFLWIDKQMEIESSITREHQTRSVMASAAAHAFTLCLNRSITNDTISAPPLLSIHPPVGEEIFIQTTTKERKLKRRESMMKKQKNSNSIHRQREKKRVSKMVIPDWLELTVLTGLQVVLIWLCVSMMNRTGTTGNDQRRQNGDKCQQLNGHIDAMLRMFWLEKSGFYVLSLFLTFCLIW